MPSMKDSTTASRLTFRNRDWERKTETGTVSVGKARPALAGEQTLKVEEAST